MESDNFVTCKIGNIFLDYLPQTSTVGTLDQYLLNGAHCSSLRWDDRSNDRTDETVKTNLY